MPDVHAGINCNVGTAYKINSYINPSHIGVDIGCSVSMYKLSTIIPADKFELFDHRVREVIPMKDELLKKTNIDEKDLYRYLTNGYNKARSLNPEYVNEIKRIDEKFITSFCKRIKLQEGAFYKSLGTLGGGNHFIEYGEDPENNGWLTIHTGSRNLGAKVANYWINKSNSPKNSNPGFLEGDEFNGYISDMVITQLFAEYNHKIISSKILEIIKKLCKGKCIETIYTT